jgi:hypothetical protein
MYKLEGVDSASFEVKDNAGAAEIFLDDTMMAGLALVPIGAADTITALEHHNRSITLDQASGSAITLPSATGSGLRLDIWVATTVTSNNHTISCAGTDEFAGVIYQVDTDTSDAVAAYPALAADNFDTITMNGTTKGGLAGDHIVLVDLASGVWGLDGRINASGVVATPLSAS